MEIYALYAAKNIFHLWKSHINAKSEKNLQNTAKKHEIKSNLLRDKNVNSENKAKDLEVKDKDNINMSIAHLYSHEVTIACHY